MWRELANFTLFIQHQYFRGMSEQEAKLKALQLTIDKLEKTYGKGTVMKLSDERVIDVPAISTG